MGKRLLVGRERLELYYDSIFYGGSKGGFTLTLHGNNATTLRLSGEDALHFSSVYSWAGSTNRHDEAVEKLIAGATQDPLKQELYRSAYYRLVEECAAFLKASRREKLPMRRALARTLKEVAELDEGA